MKGRPGHHLHGNQRMLLSNGGPAGLGIWASDKEVVVMVVVVEIKTRMHTHPEMTRKSRKTTAPSNVDRVGLGIVEAFENSRARMPTINQFAHILRSNADRVGLEIGEGVVVVQILMMMQRIQVRDNKIRRKQKKNRKRASAVEGQPRLWMIRRAKKVVDAQAPSQNDPGRSSLLQVPQAPAARKLRVLVAPSTRVVCSYGRLGNENVSKWLQRTLLWERQDN
mmetsp:Transcript_32434/g.74515  ORF Transcript_32434/g.74515 Transcript_32434/m.74515 type:complete len:223 (-) Transcript_32434:339-1007(-)